MEDLKKRIDKAHPLILQWTMQMAEDEELNLVLEAIRDRNIIITLYGMKGKPSKRPRISLP